MAKLTVVIVAISFMCLVLFDGVFTQDPTTTKAPEGVTNPPVTSMPTTTKATVKPEEKMPNPAPATGGDGGKDAKAQNLPTAAQSSTPSTAAPKTGENSEKKDNSGTTIAATVLPFVTTVFLITRF